MPVVLPGDVRVEFRDYVFRPRVFYSKPLGKLEFRVEKLYLDDGALWECEYEPYVRKRDSEVVDVGAKCKRLKAVVVSPSFARKVKEKFGEKGLKAVVMHEYAEGKCEEAGGISCHERGLIEECKVLGKEGCLKFREWLVKEFNADPKDLEYIKKFVK